MSHRPPPPMVACIMLANGRPEMVERAIASFNAQSYTDRRLLIWDTTPNPIVIPDAGPLVRICGEEGSGFSVGTLRNHANEAAFLRWPEVTLFAHWDSDDWSHPRRLEEQVELMRVTGKDAVGYNNMLFWETKKLSFDDVYGEGGPAGCDVLEEAWLFESHHPARFLGSSMLYKRKAWEASPFHPKEPNEDTLWWMKNQGRCYAESSISTTTLAETKDKTGRIAIEPRMVCAIHGANTSLAYGPEKRVAAHWRRMPNWDQYCQEAMKL